MKRIESKTPINIVLMSIILAFYLSINIILITLMPSAEGGIDSGGLLGLFYSGSAFILFLLSVLSGRLSHNKLSFYALILAIILIALYQITINYIGIPRTPFPNFLFFTIVSFLLPRFVKVDVQLFLKTIMLFSLPAIFRVGSIFRPLILSTGAITMGYSYSFLLPVIVSIVYMRYFYKTESTGGKVITVLCFIANLVYAYFLIAFGSRGPVIAIMALLIVLLGVKIHSQSVGVKIVKGKAFVVLVSVLIIVFFFIPILTMFQSILGSAGIRLGFIDKFLSMNAIGDVTSGREDIYELTYQAFKEKPLFGHGIDQFENNVGIVYPHNFILQLLYDGGIFLFSIVLIPVVRRLLSSFKTCSYNEYIVILALFFASVPGGLLSGDLWTMVTLWTLFGAVLSKQFVFKPESHEYS